MRKIREKRKRKRWRKFYRTAIVLHRKQRSTLELVSRCRKHRWQRPWRGGRRRRPSARREDDDSGLNTAQKAELGGLLEESCSTLGEGDLQGPFLLDFFEFYLLSSHALFFHHICICWRHALFFHLVFAIIEVDFNECFLMAWLLFYIDKKQYSKRFSKS